MKYLVPAVIVALAFLPTGSQWCGAMGEPGPEDQVTIEPREGGWKIEDLFRLIATETGESICYDAKSSSIAGRRIEFVGNQVVPREKLFEWSQNLLLFMNIVLVPVMGKQRWMALNMNSPRIPFRPLFVPEKDLGAWRDRHGVFIVSTVTLARSVDAERALRALSSLVTPDLGRVQRVADQATLVLSDYAPTVAAMAAAARSIEAASQVRIEEVRRIEALLATSVTETAARYFVGRLEALRSPPRRPSLGESPR